MIKTEEKRKLVLVPFVVAYASEGNQPPKRAAKHSTKEDATKDVLKRVMKRVKKL
jgi:hypothetical protein